MRSTRRGFVSGAVGATAALAGCMDSLANNAGGGGGDDANDAPQRTEYVEEGWIEDTRIIPEGKNRIWEWTWEEPWTLEYEFFVRDGPAVDVFIASEEEYDHYMDGDRFQYYGDTLDTTHGEDSVTLEAGDYVLVVDNTDLVEAQPPSNLDEDPAEVEIEATVRSP